MLFSHLDLLQELHMYLTIPGLSGTTDAAKVEFNKCYAYDPLKSDPQGMYMHEDTILTIAANSQITIDFDVAITVAEIVLKSNNALFAILYRDETNS